MDEDEARLDVQVCGLEKSYGNMRALRGVTFSVRRGEIFGYLGPNGAGKTTTINILCGLLGRDRGTLAISGMDVERHPVAVKQRIGVVPEESNLYPELTCRRNLEYLGELYGLPRARRKEHAAQLLESFDLAPQAGTRFRALSRGMKRRLTVAAALVHSPGILFLDEPTAGLDVPSARALRSLIKTVNRDGTTVLLTTHNLPEAEELCDRILILVKGAVVTQGTAREIQERVETAKTLSVVFSPEVTEQALRDACPAVRSAANTGLAWRLEISSAHDAVQQLTAFATRRNVRILELNTAGGALEDAFMSILRAGDRKPGESS